MKLSKGRSEDNIDLYNYSIKIWNELRILIRNYLRNNFVIGGNYGVIDPWCLLIIQYFLVKKTDVDIINCKRTLGYLEVYQLMQAGYYNVSNKIKNNISDKEYLALESHVYYKEGKLYDSKYVIDKANDCKNFKDFFLKLEIKRSEEKNFNHLLHELKNIIINNSLNRYFNSNEAEKLSKFLTNTIPELYLNHINNISITGLKEVLKQKPYSFIRTSSAIIDNDLIKILASELRKKGTNLHTIFHGGNESEIAYNSQYFIDYSLSEKKISLKDSISNNLPIRYNPKNLYFKKGIAIYLKEKNFQNTFLFGSETYEDQSKYMYGILELLGKLKNSIQKEIIIMRHNDLKRINLNELLFFIKKKQIFEMNSLRKRFYRKVFKPELQISTYTGTVFIESILSNIPCVLFFNPKRYELSKNMYESIEIFRDAKIFHSNSQSLSKFLNETDDFYKWWQKSLTKNAIKVFIENMKKTF